MHNFLMHILSGYSLSMLTEFYCKITQFMKSGVRKKVALFVNRSIALQCMTLKIPEPNTAYTQ